MESTPQSELIVRLRDRGPGGALSGRELADVAGCPLPEAVSSNGRLTCGLPWLSPQASARWAGVRLIWWPEGIPSFRRVSLLSSRLGRQLDQRRRWFDLLRTALLRLHRDSEGVVTVEGTAAAPAVRRGARLLDIPHLEFAYRPSAGHQTRTGSSDDWIRDVLQHSLTDASAVRGPSASESASGLCWRAFVSPLLPDESELLPARAGPTGRGVGPPESRHRDPNHTADDDPAPVTRSDPPGARHDRPAANPTRDASPLPDRLLLAAADRILLLSVRAGGGVHRLAADHLDDVERRHVPLLIAHDASAVISDLEARGHGSVVRWIVARRSEPPASPPQEDPGAFECGEPPVAAVHRGPLESPDEWLCHWTRARPGPWPDESAEDWLDELILDCESADHSAISTLWRIVACGRLLASADGIRGGEPVVAWTAVPLSEFRSRRIWRKHRQRYDFECCGVAVRRCELQTRGAEPVIYGGESEWRQLSDRDRFRFQPATAEQTASRTPIDWTQEREWRLRGDVDLKALPTDAVCLFVPTERSARAARLVSPWPVLVVPHDTADDTAGEKADDKASDATGGATGKATG